MGRGRPGVTELLVALVIIVLRMCKIPEVGGNSDVHMGEVVTKDKARGSYNFYGGPLDNFCSIIFALPVQTFITIEILNEIRLLSDMAFISLHVRFQRYFRV